MRILNVGLLKLTPWFSAGWSRVSVSWTLLALVAVCLLGSPVTQQLWAWDRFLHGGQDFETGAFLILISLCLILVLVRVCKSAFERLLTLLWGMAFSCGIAAELGPLGVPPAFLPQRRNAHAPLSLPLQI